MEVPVNAQLPTQTLREHHTLVTRITGQRVVPHIHHLLPNLKWRLAYVDDFWAVAEVCRLHDRQNGSLTAQTRRRVTQLFEERDEANHRVT